MRLSLAITIGLQRLGRSGHLSGSRILSGSRTKNAPSRRGNAQLATARTLLFPGSSVRPSRAGEEIMEDTNAKKSRTVYAILEKPGRRPYWMKIGIAHINQDQSWNVYLDAIPFDRKLQIREDDGTRPRPPQAGSERTPLPAFDIGGIQ
jgi:hypothetical protein